MYVLVPVDFSSHSEAALRYACRLAVCMGATPLVLHVVHDPGEMPGYYSKALAGKRLLGCIEDSAAAMLEKFLARMAKNNDEVAACDAIETLLVRGLPTTRILEVAQQRTAKMIVMGSRGRTGLKHLMMGSVAEQVMRLSPVPVTVVKARSATQGPRPVIGGRDSPSTGKPVAN